MRILLSFLQSQKALPIPAYSFWETYIKRAIEEEGSIWQEIPSVNWAEALALGDRGELARWREKAWSSTLRYVRSLGVPERPDYLLSYLYPQMIEREAIHQLQCLGIPCVNFFCDNIREFSSVPAEFRVFDLQWVPEYEATRMYESAGLKYIHAPMPVWIPAAARHATHIEKYGPTFIGSKDRLRSQLISSAIRLGAEIYVRGPGWIGDTEPPVNARLGISHTIANQLLWIRRHGIRSWIFKCYRSDKGSAEPFIPSTQLLEPVFGELYMKVTQQSKITLGINRVPIFYSGTRSTKVYSRLRDIEAPMMGACYLTEWAPGIEKLYEIGRDIETYSTESELASKIDYLSADSDLRKRLRRNGQERALNELSVGRSLNRIALRLGIKRN